MTIQDQVVAALTCWREARGGRPQPEAMQAVMNVIQKRSAKHGESAYTVCTTHDQFTSISPPADAISADAVAWPHEADPQWVTALSLAEQAAAGTLADITSGSLNYYALGIPAPYWTASMTPTVQIGGQAFYK